MTGTDVQKNVWPRLWAWLTGCRCLTICPVWKHLVRANQRFTCTTHDGLFLIFDSPNGAAVLACPLAACLTFYPLLRFFILAICFLDCLSLFHLLVLLLSASSRGYQQSALFWMCKKSLFTTSTRDIISPQCSNQSCCLKLCWSWLASPQLTTPSVVQNAALRFHCSSPTIGQSAR